MARQKIVRKKVREYSNQKKKRNQWLGILAALGIVIVTITAAKFILPAITAARKDVMYDADEIQMQLEEAGIQADAVYNQAVYAFENNDLSFAEEGTIGDVNARFVSWVLNQTDISEDVLPRGNWTYDLYRDTKRMDHFMGPDYLPMAGELIFLDEDWDDVPDVVGVVTGIDEAKDEISYIYAKETFAPLIGRTYGYTMPMAGAEIAVDSVDFLMDIEEIHPVISIGDGEDTEEDSLSIEEEEPEESIIETFALEEEDTDSEIIIDVDNNSFEEDYSEDSTEYLEIEEEVVEEASVVIEEGTISLYEMDVFGYGSFLPSTLDLSVLENDEELDEEPIYFEAISPLADGEPGAEPTIPEGATMLGDLLDPNNVYFKDMELSYKDINSGTFLPVKDGTKLVGNEILRIAGKYSVPYNMVESAPNNDLYILLPDYLKGIVDVHDIVVGSEKKGVLYVENSYARMHFNTLENIQFSGMVGGIFAIQFGLDMSKIPGNGTLDLGGKLNISINFDGDAFAQFGNLDIDKSEPVFHDPSQAGFNELKDYPGRSYLEYKITVTADNKNFAMPEVKVIDRVDDGVHGRYILAYAGVTGTSQKVSANSYAKVEKMGGTGADDSSLYLTTSFTDKTAVDFATPAGAEASAKTDAMVWDIGNMQAGEVRTLTYYVVLEDDYVGYHHTGKDNNGTITNNATAYSKKFSHGNDTTVFTPTANLNINKNFISDPDIIDGNYYFTYVVTITAPENNSYTMSNVKLNDYYNVSFGNEHVVYVNNSEGQRDNWKVYNDRLGGTEYQYDLNITRYTGREVNNPNLENTSVTFWIGPLAPGQSKVITYKIRVDEAAIFSGESVVKSITNHAEAYDDEIKSPESYGSNLHSDSQTDVLGTEMWERKTQGQNVSATTIQPSGGEYYKKVDGTWTNVTGSVTASDKEFRLPDNSLKYQVVANEGSNWNLSGATFKDELGKMNGQPVYNFAGWIQMQAYDLSSVPEANRLKPDASLQDALNFFAGRPVAKTTWIYVDGENSFDFKPTDVGLSSQYAYLMTYYTKPANLSFAGQFSQSNTFTLNGGIVGPGGINKTLTNVWVSTSKNVSGQYGFQNKKLGWYYEAPTPAQVSAGPYEKGQMYWLLKVDVTGGKLLENTGIRDIQQTNSLLLEDGLVGVYVGPRHDLPDTAALLRTYSDLAVFQADTDMRAYQAGEDYSATYDEYNHNFTIRILKDLEITENQSLYCVVKTMPEELPQDEGKAVITYNNQMQMASSVTPNTWGNNSNATQTLRGTYPLKKEAHNSYSVKLNNNRVPTFTVVGAGDKITSETNNTNTEIPILQRLHVDYEAGTTGIGGTNTTNFYYEDGAVYLSWLITANPDGDMEGAFSILDTLPEGVELSYIRTYMVNIIASAVNSTYSLQAIDASGINGGLTLNQFSGGNNTAWSFTGRNAALENDGWTLHNVLSKCTGTTNGLNATLTTYYTRKNGTKDEALIYIPNMHHGSNGQGKVVFQVVCKVTREFDKREPQIQEFPNTAKLYPEANLGNALNEVDSEILLNYSSMSKQLAADTINDSDKVMSYVFPFSVDVNDAAEDLDPDAEKLVMVDEMGKNLHLVSDSVRVIDLDTMQELTRGDGEDQWRFEYNNTGADANVLQVYIPDRRNVRVEYTANMEIAPRESAKLSNNAHWRGYKNFDNSSIDQDIIYDVEVTANPPIIFTILKKDSETFENLPGAYFSITEVQTTKKKVDDITEVEIVRDSNNEPIKLTGTTRYYGPTLEADTTTEKDPVTGEVKILKKGSIVIDTSKEGADDLEYDRVYCLEETKAPHGYQRDFKKYYFVIKNLQTDGTYYSYVDAEEIKLRQYPFVQAGSIEYEVFNSKAKAQVTKGFGTGITAQSLPGTYRFGLFPGSAVTKNASGQVTAVDKVAMLDEQSVSYNATEAAAILAETTLEAREQHYKYAEFLNLQYDEEYYIFEMNDANEPILDNGMGTINGRGYTVDYSHYNEMGGTQTSGNRIFIDAEETKIPVVKATNADYKISITKSFTDESGNKLERGLQGTYRFGLWPEERVINLVPQGSPVQIKEIAWGAADTAAEKSVIFEGLSGNKKFYVYELGANDKPILHKETAMSGGHRFNVTYSDAGVTTTKENNGVVSMSVNNAATISMPYTGGIGTHIFRILGLLSMLLAGGILLIRSNFIKGKKLLGMLLAIGMILTLLPGMVAYAADVNHVVNIKQNNPNHVFEAYQLFAGDITSESGNVYISNLRWGTNIDAAGFLAELKADTQFNNLFANDVIEDPGAIAKKIATCNKLQRVAKIAVAHLQGNPKAITDVLVGAAGSNSAHYELKNLDSGYYLFLDHVKPGTSLVDGDSLSRYMMEIVNDTSVEPKPQGIPLIDKSVVNANDSKARASTYAFYDTGADSNQVLNGLQAMNWKKAADHDIGDSIIYNLDVTLPEEEDEGAVAGFGAYANYKVVLSDTLSKGLTLDRDSIRIYVGHGSAYREITSQISSNEDVVSGNRIATSYIKVNASTAANGETAFSVTINSVKADNIGARAEDHILVFYQCVLNENAVIGSVGNPNSVYMEYSNNPNATTMGKTKTVTNTVFTYQFSINKMAGDRNIPLDGADFRLDKFYKTYIVSIPSGKQAFYDNGFKGTQGRIWLDAQGVKYYKNTITGEVEASTEALGSAWKEISTVNAGETLNDVWVEVTDKTITGSGSSKASVFTYKGLDDGEYVVTETKIPDGYNGISPITFTISSALQDASATPALQSVSITNASTAGVNQTSTSGQLSSTIVNKRGSILPRTGGIGTKIFYLLGSIMVIGAGVLLVTRYRMGNKDK